VSLELASKFVAKSGFGSRHRNIIAGVPAQDRAPSKPSARGQVPRVD